MQHIVDGKQPNSICICAAMLCLGLPVYGTYTDEATVDEEEYDGEDQAPARLCAEYLSSQEHYLAAWRT